MEIILVASIAIQIVAAGLALRQALETPPRVAWALISLAMAAMGGRGLAVLLGALPLDPVSEIAWLAVAVLMALGLGAFAGNKRARPAPSQPVDDVADGIELHAVFDNTAQAILAFDEDARIEAINPAAAKIFGYERADIVGEHVTKLIPEYDRGKAETAPIDCKTFGKRSDGELFPIECSISEIGFRGKRVCVGVFRDVTDYDRAEEALKISEQRFRDFASSTADRFWETDADHRFTYLSPPPVGSPRINSEYVIGRTWWELEPDRENDSLWQWHHRNMEAKKPFRDFRFTRTYSDGTVIRLRASGWPIFDDSGTFRGYRGTVLDETTEARARQQAESAHRRLADALEHSSDGVVLWDADEKLVAWNQRFEELNPVVSPLMEQGVTFEALMRRRAKADPPPFNRGTAEEWVEQRVADFRRGSYEREERFAGRSFIVRTQRLPDGEIIVSQTDITDRKAQEEQLRQSQKMEAVGQLTGGIAHDFNNILASILGNLEMLEMRIAGREELTKWVSRAMKSVKRGSVLTGRLLAFSRKQTLTPEATDVGTLVGGMVDMLERSLGEWISIKTEAAPDLWSTLVDQNQLENAILNLAINARDAMPDGGVLTITCENKVFDVPLDPDDGPDKRDYVLLTVADTGQGIAPAVLDRVFEPFFSTKELGSGSGLGLSMVYGFVKQSGGHIEVKSELKVGTEVRIYLPKFVGEVQQTAEPEASDGPPMGTGQRIMIIEDDPDVRDVTLDMLAGLGYRTFDGGDGQSLMQPTAKMPDDIDLLLTDVILPNGINGIDVASEMRKRCTVDKVLLMSGYADEDLVTDNDRHLKYPMIKKPFGKVDLARKVSEVLNGV